MKTFEKVVAKNFAHCFQLWARTMIIKVKLTAALNRTMFDDNNNNNNNNLYFIRKLCVLSPRFLRESFTAFQICRLIWPSFCEYISSAHLHRLSLKKQLQFVLKLPPFRQFVLTFCICCCLNVPLLFWQISWAKCCQISWQSPFKVTLLFIHFTKREQISFLNFKQ